MDNADMNDDGKISLLDVGKVQNLVNELNPDMGDVNDDGVIDQKDAEAIKLYRLGYDVKINMDKADMNGDGKITISDVSQVQQLADINDPQVLKGDANGDGKVNYRDVKAIELAEINLGGKIDSRAADMDDDGENVSSPPHTLPTENVNNINGTNNHLKFLKIKFFLAPNEARLTTLFICFDILVYFKYKHTEVGVIRRADNTKHNLIFRFFEP